MKWLNINKKDRNILTGFIAVVLLGPLIMEPIGGGYPDLLQKFAIFGILLWGITFYLD